jgi:hypothetical protein
MLAEGGIKAESKPLTATGYSNEMLRVYAQGETRGFHGIGQKTVPVFPTLHLHFYALLHPSGRNFMGLTPNGLNASKGDPELTGLIDSFKNTFDVKAAQQIAHQIQRLMALRAYGPNLLVDSPQFSLAWPVLGNYGAFTQANGGVGTAESDLNLWLDESKAPVRKA